MKKKNLVLMGSAAVLSLALAGSIGAVVVASAADITSGGSNTQTVEVTYSVNNSWTVSIPGSIVVGNDGASQKVKASDVLIGEGQSLKVTVSSGNEWKLKGSGSVEFGYELKVDGTVYSDSVLTVNAGTTESVEKILTANLKGDDANAGKYSTNGESYTDELTFTVTVS